MAKFVVNKNTGYTEHEFTAEKFVASEHLVTFYDYNNDQVGAVRTADVITILQAD